MMIIIVMIIVIIIIIIIVIIIIIRIRIRIRIRINNHPRIEILYLLFFSFKAGYGRKNWLNRHVEAYGILSKLWKMPFYFLHLFIASCIFAHIY